MRYLTFALGKGRLVDSTMELLNKCGIKCDEILDKKTRKLTSNEVGFFLSCRCSVHTPCFPILSQYFQQGV